MLVIDVAILSKVNMEAVPSTDSASRTLYSKPISCLIAWMFSMSLDPFKFCLRLEAVAFLNLS